LSLNAREVAEILQALEASSFDSLDLEIGAVKLSLRRTGAGQAAPTAAAKYADPQPPTRGTGGAATTATSGVAPPGAVPVPAPLLGVFHRSPRPGEPPYVEVGDRVAPDTIIGIIEVMKLMNTVRAGLSGQIVAIPARNGELIEFGEAVIHVHPD
jgi:acetyl-CoA carboxylase biotin carboxyl carrier protein